MAGIFQIPPKNDRLPQLRQALAAAGLSGFLVPHADEHQSEYLPAAAERLAWLTGFTGSAGMAIVLADAAAIFVDGRYTLQVRNQVDAGQFAPEHIEQNPPAKWLTAHLKAGDRVGYDPWLTTVAEARRFAEACAAAEAKLVAVAENPINRLWRDRPEAPLGQVWLHPIAFAGEAAADKIARVQDVIAAKKVDAAVLGQADSIAWLLNIRGSDISHNPVALAFLTLPATGKPSLFIDGRKLSNSVRVALGDIVDVKALGELNAALGTLGAAKARVLIDGATTSEAIADAIGAAGGTIVEGGDPVMLPRAKKNATEIAGSRRAHVRDGAAMVRFLAWLGGAAPRGDLDEIAVAEKLRAFRAETAERDGVELVDLSFDTISGAGPNGAIIHYRVTPATSLRLKPDMLYLIDSGAQYRDGTTDVTRTVAVGTPTAEMGDRFTRVFKGHVALATAKLPTGGLDAQLDSLARVALWQAGLDFDHGTGHGIGSFLSVHEGPTRVSKRGHTPLEPGMIFSNEPGYYKTGEYGIRIENLLLVLPPTTIPGGEREMLTFETLSLAPIDRRLIVPQLMTADEIGWLNGYHASLPGKLGHLLDDGEKAWLAAATQPIGQ